MHITPQGRVVGHSGPGSAVGGIGVLARDEEGIEAVAEADTLTLEIAADALFELMEDHFSIFHHVLREVCLQMIEVVSRFPAATRAAPSRGPGRAASAPRDLDLVERIMFLRAVGRSSPAPASTRWPSSRAAWRRSGSRPARRCGRWGSPRAGSW